MAVNWQTIEIPFGGGINTKTNPRRLQPPDLEDIQNLVFTDAPGYKVRYGSTELTAVNATSDGAAFLMPFNNQLIHVNHRSGFQQYDSLNAQWESSFGEVGPTLTEEELSASSDEQYDGAVAELDGIKVHAWMQNIGGSANLRVDIRDKATGTVIDGRQIGLSTVAQKPRIVASSSAIYVFYWDPGSTALEYLKVTAATGADSTGSVHSSMHSDGIFDVCNDPTDADSFFIAYKETTPQLEGLTFNAVNDTTGTVAVLSTTSSEEDVNALAICADQTYVWLIASDDSTPTVYTDRYTHAFASKTRQDAVSASAVNVAIAANPNTTNTGSGVWTAYTVEATDPYNNTVRAGAATGLGDATWRHVSLASGGFSIKQSAALNQEYVVLQHDSGVDASAGTPVRNRGKVGLQRTFFLAEMSNSTTPSYVGRWAPGIARSYETKEFLPKVFNISDYKAVVSLTVNTRLEQATDFVPGADNFSQTRERVCTLDWSDTSGRLYYAQAGGTLYYGMCGSLFEFSGGNAATGTFDNENIFWVFPENVSVAETTGGSLTTSSTYNYRVYLARTNRAGEEVISTTAEVVQATLNTTNNAVDITIPTVTTIRDSNWTHFVVFRSEADADVSSGAPFYRVSSPDPGLTGLANGYVSNSFTADSVSFTDELSDDDLITKELDYLNTGELDNISAPVGNYVAQAKGRLWVSGGVYKNVAYFSKLRSQGKTVSFNETNQIILPDDSDPGGITAIAELNHFVVFFKNDSIYVVSGDGPDNLGRGFFNEPQRVTSDVGCSEPRSVVSYDGGLLFKSDKGIYRLGQNLQVDYIGAPVEGYNSQDITAATLVNDQNQIRFLTSSGRMLVFDYLVGQWTTFTGWTGISAVNWRNGDVYVWAESDGTVHQEDSSTFEDNGTPVDTSFTTAPITLSGLGGFYRMQRVHFTGDYSTLTNFEVTPYYDGASTGTEASVLTSALDTTNPFNVVFNMPRQKFSDVKFKITMDKSNSGTSEGVTLQAMRAKVAYKPGLNKLSDGNKFGS